MKNISIAILSCQHVPDDVRVTHRLGRGFREAGFDVTWIGPERERSGEDYGIKFIYYRPTLSKLGRLTHAARLMRVVRSVERHDVYFAAAPDSAAVAVKLARRNQSKAVFDIQEIYHQEMLGRWVPRPFRRVVGAIVQRSITKTCRSCDLVVGVGQSRLDPYTDATVPQMIVTHCVPKDFCPVSDVEPFREGDETLVIMHGKSSMAHGTEELMRAVSILVNKYSVACKVVMFKQRTDLASHADAPVLSLAKELGIASCIDLKDPVPFSEMFSLMSTCDVGVIAYRQEFGKLCMPNRIFEYMAVGLPVIAPSYAEEMQRIIARWQCGLLCDTENAEEFGATLFSLWADKKSAREMGAAGRQAFEKELNWESESRPLLSWIQSSCR